MSAFGAQGTVFVRSLVPLVLARKIISEAVVKLREQGATVIDDTEGIVFDQEEFARQDDLVMGTDCKADLAEYFASLAKTSVHTLADVIQ